MSQTAMSLQRVILAALFVAPLSVQAAEPASKVEAEVDLSADILVAIQLPTIAHKMRVAGVPEAEVEVALVSMRESEVHAGAAATALVTAHEAVEKKGPVENFGTFVKAELAAGKRGKKLAAAIKAEHNKRGIGKGKKLAEWHDPRGKAKGHGKDKGEDEAGDDGGPPGKAKGHDKFPDGEPPGKAKGHDKDKGDPPGKAKGHDKDKDKGDPPGKAKGHDKDKDKGKGKAKGHDKAKDDPPGKAKGHDKDKPKGKGKGHDKPKGPPPGKAKGKGKK